jgi:hypothetical protein
MDAVIETAPERPRKTEAIPLRRGLSLYKQPKSKGRGSPNWYARAYLDVGGRKLHARSTGTTDENLARQRADEFRLDLEIQRRQLAGLLPVSADATGAISRRFDRLADEWLDLKKREAGTDPRRLRGHKDAKQVLLARNGLATFFGRTDVASITTDQINAFLAFAVENSKHGRLAPGTQQRQLVVLREVLTFAFDKRLIPGLPRIPKIKQKDNPRPSFTRDEYRRLVVMAYLLERKARQQGDKAGAALWAELRDFIVFMLNSFLRPSEWADLRQSDIEAVDHGPNPHLKISLTQGKTGPRSVVTMPECVRAYQRTLTRSGVDPDQHLFLHSYQNRDTALQIMRQAFNRLLQDAGLTHDRFGKKRVIYSLRHSALTFRILDGNKVDHFVLASNAGTSLAMLHRFYLKGLRPIMMIENLQSQRDDPERTRRFR